MFKEKRKYRILTLQGCGVRVFETYDMPFLQYVKEIREEGLTGVKIISDTGRIVTIPLEKCKCSLCLGGNEKYCPASKIIKQAKKLDRFQV